MGCCGQKREKWLSNSREGQKGMSDEIPLRLVIADRSNRIFEFTGEGSLHVPGIFSGRVYHFRQTGERLEVAYEDSYALMAVPGLRWIIAG